MNTTMSHAVTRLANVERATASRATEFAPPAGRSLAHVLALGAVWLTFAASGVVFSEPAPVDVLMAGLVILLPTIGLVRFTPLLMTYGALWLVAAAGAYLAATLSLDAGRSAMHTSVSLFLYLGSFIIAGFVALRPETHVRLIYSGWTFAAVLAAGLGLIGYMNALPGSYDLFTRFGRVAGTFKDPNVFGPFLVVPFLVCLGHMIANRGWAGLGSLLGAGFFGVAILLCFSRGAWFNLAVAVVLFVWLSFVTSRSAAERARILFLTAAGLAAVAAAIAVVVQFEAVSRLLAERASLTQSYDVGPDVRFGGQMLALELALSHPLGIGAQVFSPFHHHEEVHNVYLSILLNAGWLGGGVYWIMVALTAVLGLRHAFIGPAAHRPLLLIAYAAFIATAIEGLIIDSDHWRSFYVQMAIVWGLLAADPRRTG